MHVESCPLCRALDIPGNNSRSSSSSFSVQYFDRHLTNGFSICRMCLLQPFPPLHLLGAWLFCSYLSPSDSSLRRSHNWSAFCRTPSAEVHHLFFLPHLRCFFIGRLSSLLFRLWHGAGSLLVPFSSPCRSWKMFGFARSYLWLRCFGASPFVATCPRFPVLAFWTGGVFACFGLFFFFFF